MLHRTMSKIMHSLGKKTPVATDYPDTALFRICLRRTRWLIWSVIRIRRFGFISPLASIEGGCNLIYSTGATIEPWVRINALANEKCKIGERSKIGAYSRIVASPTLSMIGKGFTIGHDSSCGEFCYFGAVGGIKIGNRVLMGQYVSIHAQEHNFDDPCKPMNEQGTSECGVSIGDDCWIGAKATILDGARIGKHCVIAAGAVVKGEFPDYCVIGGVPARIIRRLDQDSAA